jgi:hypothetical protein
LNCYTKREKNEERKVSEKSAKSQRKIIGQEHQEQRIKGAAGMKRHPVQVVFNGAKVARIQEGTERGFPYRLPLQWVKLLLKIQQQGG